MPQHRKIAAVALLAILACAQPLPERNVGVVDVAKALNETREGAAARQRLAQMQRELEARAKPSIERFEALLEEYRREESTLSEDSLRQKQGLLIERRKEIDVLLKELEFELATEKKRLEAPLRKKLIEVVADVAARKHLDLVLGHALPAHSAILYTRTPGIPQMSDDGLRRYRKGAVDISEQVITRFNESPPAEYDPPGAASP